MRLKGVFSKKPLLYKIVTLFMVTFLSSVIFSIISHALLPLFFDISISELPSFLSDYNSQKSVNGLKFLQFFTSLGLFVLPPLLFAYLTDFQLHLNKKIDRQNVLLVIVIILMINPFVAYLMQWNQALVLPDFLESTQKWMEAYEYKAMQITEAFLQMQFFSDLLINLLLIAFIPAIGEELLFRGVLQQLLARWTGKMHLAIFLAAFLFSAIHLQFFGFFPRLILGILLGYLFFWSKNLWLPILAHFTNNTLAIIFSYHLIVEKVQIDFMNHEASINLRAALISFFAVALLMYLLYSKSSIKKG